MRKAITTKYLGASATKPGRVKATDGDNSIILAYDHEKSGNSRHAAVACALAEKMQGKSKGGWAGFWVAGTTKDGYVFVNMAPDRDHPGGFAGRHMACLARGDIAFGPEGVEWFYLPSEMSGLVGTEF